MWSKVYKQTQTQWCSVREYIFQAEGKPSLQKIHLPQLTNATIPELPVLCHVEDTTSPSFWNTPFRVKFNLHGQVLDATLDTGTSLSEVQADIVQDQAKMKANVKPWTAPPIQLADGGACQPLGLTWLAFGFMGQRFYHHCNCPMPTLNSVLGMDFMLRHGTIASDASITIHIPSGTVAIGNEPLFTEELEGS